MDLNVASYQDLLNLYGVGDVRARAILQTLTFRWETFDIARCFRMYEFAHGTCTAVGGKRVGTTTI